MVSILVALRTVNHMLDQWLPGEQIYQACRQAGYRFRERILNPAATVHLLVLQLMAHSALRGVRRVAQLSLVSRQAIHQARQRLPLSVLLQLVQQLCQRMVASIEPTRWQGLQLVLVDGSCCYAPDTPTVRAKYGKGSNQRGSSPGCALVRLLAVMDYRTGLLQRIIAMPWAHQEKSLLATILRKVAKSSLILADRGLVSYAHAALMLRQGMSFCLYSPRQMVVQGRGNTSHRRLRRQGKQDLLVTWKRVRCPKWMSRLRFGALPQCLQLRQIAFRLHRPGYRPRWQWLITNLLDSQKYPTQELIDLALRRWQVEVDLRDLKKTLRMKHLRSRGPQMIRKEVAAYVILYNLVRLTALEAAKQQEVDPDRVSFIDAADWLLWSAPGTPLPKLEVNAIRRRPTQPRELKYKDRKYPRLRAPRATRILPPFKASV
jgi:Transposase DDE domain